MYVSHFWRPNSAGLVVDQFCCFVCEKALLTPHHLLYILYTKNIAKIPFRIDSLSDVGQRTRQKDTHSTTVCTSATAWRHALSALQAILTWSVLAGTSQTDRVSWTGPINKVLACYIRTSLIVRIHGKSIPVYLIELTSRSG